MMLLDSAAVRYVRSWLGEPEGPGVLDLYHGLACHRRGIWGDDARAPKSVVLVREGNGQLEAFGAGEPEPAVSWLTSRAGKPVALLAPKEWWAPVGRRVRATEKMEMLTFELDTSESVPRASGPIVVTRRLIAEDNSAFLTPALAPPWALLGWTSFEDLITYGVGFVAPFGAGLASAAWTYSQASRYDAIGVATVERFRRLGLGRAVASALISHIIDDRGKTPLWTTSPDNTASRELAESLGFELAATETFLRWHPNARGPR